MPKHGLCQTAKRIMTDYVESKSVGDMFCIDELVKYVDQTHKQITVTTRGATSWCNRNPELIWVSTGLWKKVALS